MSNPETDMPTARQLLKAASQSLAQPLAVGEVVGIDPDLADFMGAFEETGLDEEAALASRFDHLDLDQSQVA